MHNVFVYGTLKPGHGRWPILRDVAEDYYPATTEGQLISFGAYPGAVFYSDPLDVYGLIHGYVVTVKEENLAYILNILDGIEGVNRGLFRRANILCWREDDESKADSFYAIAYEICTVPEGKWQPELDEE